MQPRNTTVPRARSLRDDAARAPQRQRFHSKRRAIAVAIALACASGGASANAWINPGAGDWFSPANWEFGAVPQADFMFGTVDSGGRIVVGSPGALTFALRLGSSASTGNLDVTGAGTMIIHDTLDLERGSVRVLAGGKLTMASIGASAQTLVISAPGSVLVDGAGSVLTAPELNTSGTITIQNGGRMVNTQAFTHGTVIVSGANSTWQPTTLDLFEGNLIVTTGGQVQAGIAAVLGGSTATIVGTGSTLNVMSVQDNALQVGFGDEGHLNVVNGASLISHGAAIRGSGFDAASNPNATVTIAGPNASWFNLGALAIGGETTSTEAGPGMLTVANGGFVFTGSTSLGNNAGSFGKATIGGGGAQLQVSGDLTVGHQAVGIVEVDAGGLLLTSRGIVADAAGSQGAVTVTGAGARWLASAPLIIGNRGNGQINIAAGGLVSTSNSAFLGFVAGSQGVANISGAGSTWNVNAAGTELDIGGNGSGAAGSGAVEVGDGGTVNTVQTNLYQTGALALEGNGHFTGHITSTGGLISALGVNTLGSAITLGDGGMRVITSTPTTLATFNGNIDGSGGLSKNSFLGSGAGTLVLNGTNTYTGATNVNIGALLVNGSSVSETTVNTGTLGGTGLIAAAVHVGNGAGNHDAVLAPGQGGIGKLTTGNLGFASDGAFAFQIDSATATADQVAVDGDVAIDPLAMFLFSDLSGLALAAGTTFTAIDNDGVDAIVGRFANLLDGELLTLGLNEFLVNYEGGTGNDLVFTVFSDATNPPPPDTVPEPSIVLLMGVGVLAFIAEARRRRRTADGK